LNDYLSKGVIARDPFVSLDIDGVGELVKIAAERDARPAKSSSLHLRRTWRRSGFHSLLSRLGSRLCLLFTIRVPVARLAAAQAALKKSRNDV